MISPSRPSSENEEAFSRLCEKIQQTLDQLKETTNDHLQLALVQQLSESFKELKVLDRSDKTPVEWEKYIALAINLAQLLASLLGK